MLSTKSTSKNQLCFHTLKSVTKKKNPAYTNIKIIKYLVLDLTKKVKNLYTEIRH